jgi:hypothetical protein
MVGIEKQIEALTREELIGLIEHMLDASSPAGRRIILAAIRERAAESQQPAPADRQGEAPG